MLPKGEWPKWCRSCDGSGLEYCHRCLGMGEYRDTIEFKFLEKYVVDKDNERHRAQLDRRDPHSFSELLRNDDQVQPVKSESLMDSKQLIAHGSL